MTQQASRLNKIFCVGNSDRVCQKVQSRQIVSMSEQKQGWLLKQNEQLRINLLAKVNDIYSICWGADKLIRGNRWAGRCGSQVMAD